MSTTPIAIPIGLSNMPSALGRTTFSLGTRDRRASLVKRGRAGCIDDVGDVSVRMDDESGTLALWHVVHVF